MNDEPDKYVERPADEQNAISIHVGYIGGYVDALEAMSKKMKASGTNSDAFTEAYHDVKGDLIAKFNSDTFNDMPDLALLVNGL